MLVVSEKSQLANQMFAYASVKTIALDHGYEFKYIHEHCSYAEGSYSTADPKYGKDFDTIFVTPDSEKATAEDIKGLKVFSEIEFINAQNTHYIKEATKVKDDTFMDGHFICPRYFYHRITEVRQWFTFASDINSAAKNEIEKIRKKSNQKKLIAIHFRVGHDYRNYGYRLAEDYWSRAAQEMQKKCNNNCVFVLFYDKKTKIVERFKKNFYFYECHGSLAHDMCAMTKCDHIIISNSTFSMMGALLNPASNKIVIRPSIYPISYNQEQKGSYLEEWISVSAKRDKVAFILSLLRIGKIRNKLLNIYYKLRLQNNGKHIEEDTINHNQN